MTQSGMLVCNLSCGLVLLAGCMLAIYCLRAARCLLPHLCGSADGQDTLTHAHAIQARTGHICDCGVCVHHEAVPAHESALEALQEGLLSPAFR